MLISQFHQQDDQSTRSWISGKQEGRESCGSVQGKKKRLNTKATETKVTYNMNEISFILQGKTMSYGHESEKPQVSLKNYMWKLLNLIN